MRDASERPDNFHHPLYTLHTQKEPITFSRSFFEVVRINARQVGPSDANLYKAGSELFDSVG